MIKSITLSNFRRHEYLELEFDQGLNSIVGSENAGKSTILHAIIYCLFGAQASGIPADRLWRRGISATEAKHVVVMFQDGHVLLRNDNGARVFSPNEGNVIAAGQTPVTKWVEDRFGMSKADLLLMMHSPPNETRALLETGPAGLQVKVEKLAGVDVIDTVLGKLKPDLDRASGVLAANVEVDESMLAELKDTVSELIAKNMALSDHAGAMFGQHQIAVETKAKAEQAWKQAYETNSQIEQLRYSLRTLESIHAQAHAQLSTARDILAGLPEPDPDRIGILEFALSEAEQQLASAVKMRTERDLLESDASEIRSWLVEKSTAAERNIQASQAWKEAEEAMSELSRVLDKAETAKVDAVNKFKEADNFLNTGVCSKCDRPFEHFDRDAAEKERTKAMSAKILAEDAYIEARAAYQAAVKTEGELKRAVDHKLPGEWLQKNDRLTELEERLKGMHAVTDEELSDKTAKRDRLAEKFRQARQDLNDHDELTRGVERLESDVTRAADQKAWKELELKSAEEKAIPVQEAEDRMKEASVRETEAQVALTTAQLELNDTRHRLETLQKELTTMEGQREKWLEAKAEVDVLTALQKYLRSSRARLSKDIWEGLLAYASHLVSLASSGLLNRITRNDRGEFMVDGHPALDQGEAMKAVIGLSLRVAMARTFQGSGLPLLLDEVSANARDGVAAMTAGMLAGLGNQVIAVTHRSGDAVLGKILEVG